MKHVTVSTEYEWKKFEGTIESAEKVLQFLHKHGVTFSSTFSRDLESDMNSGVLRFNPNLGYNEIELRASDRVVIGDDVVAGKKTQSVFKLSPSNYEKFLVTVGLAEPPEKQPSTWSVSISGGGINPDFINRAAQWGNGLS